MPLYLVRWPDLSAALVTADDAEHLVEVLDELANPDGASWSEYRGPVFLDFELPVGFKIEERTPGLPAQPENIVIGDVKALLAREWPRVKIPSADTAGEMVNEILRSAFPHVAELWDETNEELNETSVREALKKELDVLVRALWRIMNVRRSEDPIDRIAATMDMPPRLVRRYVDQAEKKRPPKKPRPGGGRGPKKKAAPRGRARPVR